MKYPQHNPLPIPASGPSEAVTTTMDSVLDWKYALERENLLSLYEKGKAATWNASDLDWSIDVDLERTSRERSTPESRDLFNQMMKPPRVLDLDESIEMNLNMNAWMLSQFLHGEQGALLASAKIVQQVPDE